MRNIGPLATLKGKSISILFYFRSVSFWLILIGLCIMSIDKPAYAIPQSKSSYINVLLLYSWHKDLPWQKSIESGFRRKLAVHNISANIFAEYIDAGRFPLVRTEAYIYELLKNKYADTRVDIIISEGFAAAKMFKNIEGLFPNAGKIIINSLSTEKQFKTTYLWEIKVQQDLPNAIQTMINVYNPERIAVVADVLETDGRQRLSNFKSALEKVGTSLPVVYLTAPSLDDILIRTKKLPDKTAIFYLLYFKDSKGNSQTPYKAVQQIARTANAPIFTHWESLMGSGVVGGYLLSGENVGSKAADVIISAIEKRSWEGIEESSPIETDLFQHQYDWRQLQRWRIAKEHLPENSRIFFRPPGLYESYPVEMTVLMSFFIILIALVMTLIILNRRRKALEIRLRTIVETIPELVWLKDRTGKYLACNPRFERFFGASEKEIIGKTDHDFVEKELADFFRNKDEEAIAARQSTLNEEKLIYADDNHCEIVETIKTPLYDVNGNLTGVLGIARDITERKNAEQKLKSELRINEARAEISRELMAINYDIQTVSEITLKYAKDLTRSEHGFVSSIDKKTLENVGHTLSDMFGDQCLLKDQRIAFPIGDDGKYSALWGHALNTQKAFFTNSPKDHPSSNGLPDGHVPLKNYLAVPVLFSSELIGLIALANSDQDYSNQDITSIQHLSELFALAIHRQEYESEKANLEKNLRQSQKMESIGNLAGGIAHDFNNILTAIIGYTELSLDETSKGSPLEDSLQEVYSAGKRAKELVKQILAFARQSDEKRSPIQPSLVAKEVLQFIRSTVPTTIEIRQEIESDAFIMANTIQVHQVLMNLCTNAAHAMEEKGGVMEVLIKDVAIKRQDLSTGMRPGYYVEIKVLDTGVGIPSETIGSIFEPYFTTKGHGEGTGMGLAMAHGIIESYGGKITVNSQLEKGTTFSIYLPITKQRKALGEYVPEQLPSGSEHILLVDDEAPIAKIGRLILERLGYRVTTRTSSVEALELFREKHDAFDLVVTDMTMPNMTGDILAIELMKIRSDIPVVLCTGYSNKISDETAYEVGIKAFAYKPMVKADMAKTIRKVLDEAKTENQM